MQLHVILEAQAGKPGWKHFGYFLAGTSISLNQCNIFKGYSYRLLNHYSFMGLNKSRLKYCMSKINTVTVTTHNVLLMKIITFLLHLNWWIGKHPWLYNNVMWLLTYVINSPILCLHTELVPCKYLIEILLTLSYHSCILLFWCIAYQWLALLNDLHLYGLLSRAWWNYLCI